MNWVANFAQATWPTYGQNKQWRDGDKIFYTRPDVIGDITSVGSTTLAVSSSGNEKKYRTFENKELAVYIKGVQADISSLKAGDSVFTIERISETYRARLTEGSPPTNPQSVGLVAVVKLSLPGKYYADYQNYIQEVFGCMGNEQDHCENSISIDVFPRGGEGTTNPAFDNEAYGEVKQIAGKITAMNGTEIVIQSTSGRQFTIQLPETYISSYNQKWAPNYVDMGDKAYVRVGSTIDVQYGVKEGAPLQTISEKMIKRLSLTASMLNSKDPNYKAPAL